MREGLMCIPRTWVSMGVFEHRRDREGVAAGLEREEGTGPGRLGKLRSGVHFALRARQSLEGCRQERQDSVFTELILGLV